MVLLVAGPATRCEEEVEATCCSNSATGSKDRQVHSHRAAAQVSTDGNCSSGPADLSCGTDAKLGENAYCSSFVPSPLYSSNGLGTQVSAEGSALLVVHHVQ